MKVLSSLDKTGFRVRYTGEDGAEIRNGDVYDAIDISDHAGMYGVKDLSGEYYAYPKSLFEKIEMCNSAEQSRSVK